MGLKQFDLETINSALTHSEGEKKFSQQMSPSVPPPSTGGPVLDSGCDAARPRQPNVMFEVLKSLFPESYLSAGPLLYQNILGVEFSTKLRLPANRGEDNHPDIGVTLEGL